MTSLATQISRSARWFAGAEAAVDGQRRRTFAQLEERSNRLANSLLGLSGSAHGRVAIMLPNSLEFLETDLAVLKAGKAKVPINTRLTEDEREYILADSGADVLVTDEAGAEVINAARGRLEDLRHTIVVADRAPGALTYEDVIASGSSRPPTVREDEFAPSVLLYTSGTTGRPKGAVASFRSRQLTTAAMLTDELSLTEGDGMIHAGSMAHGSGSKSLAFFLRGARNIMMRKFDAEAFFDVAQRERATHSFLVPTMIATLVEAVSRGGGSGGGTLKSISYGGAPIAERLLLEALDAMGAIFVQVYGTCEAPHPLTILRQADHANLADGLAGSIGREVLGVELRLRNGDDGLEEAADVGELQVRGDSIMTGYWRNPAASEAAFVDGWYRTGDVARRDERGYYYIVDRIRDMIISGGLNVYPAEVERVISEHPAVAEVAVIGVPDEKWGEAVAAIVVPRIGDQLTELEIVEHCRTRLAGYKKPQLVEFRAELPKGSTGKILKREIRAPYWESQERLIN